MAGKPVRFPFTQQNLEEAERTFRASHPGADHQLVKYALANEIAISVFGFDWWDARLAGSGSDPFFLADSQDPLERFIHEARVTQLGAALLVCQHLDGFAELRARFITRTLPDVFHELNVARMLHENGHRVRFVKESGVRGQDFDLLVNDALAVEAKAKEERSFSASALRYAIGSDRTQLPSEGPGLFIMRIPDAWATDPAFVAEADGVFNNAVRSSNSRRINAIVVLWDEWLMGVDGGAACLVRFRIYECDNPRTDFPDLSRVIRSAAFDGSLQSANLELKGGEWTVALKVRRFDGPGAVIESFDGGIQIGIERAGNLGFRVGGVFHRTAVSVSSIDRRWIRLVVRHGAAGTDVFLDDEFVDSWTAPLTEHQGMRLCPQVDADVREALVYAERLGNEEVRQLSQHLERPGMQHVAFRRGDVARYRAE